MSRYDRGFVRGCSVSRCVVSCRSNVSRRMLGYLTCVGVGGVRRTGGVTRRSVGGNGEKGCRGKKGTFFS